MIMKKFIENSKLAKTILLGGYIAITLGPWAFNKKTYDQESKNHEATHINQWAEWTILSGFILTILSCICINPAWILASPFIYYILYVSEWLIRLITNGSDAYRKLSFEQEAYDNEDDNTYNTNRNHFASLKYLFK